MKTADNQLRKLAGEHVVCRRLMTVPGIGPVTASEALAAFVFAWHQHWPRVQRSLRSSIPATRPGTAVLGSAT